MIGIFTHRHTNTHWWNDQLEASCARVRAPSPTKTTTKTTRSTFAEKYKAKTKTRKRERERKENTKSENYIQLYIWIRIKWKYKRIIISYNLHFIFSCSRSCSVFSSTISRVKSMQKIIILREMRTMMVMKMKMMRIIAFRLALLLLGAAYV